MNDNIWTYPDWHYEKGHKGMTKLVDRKNDELVPDNAFIMLEFRDEDTAKVRHDVWLSVVTCNSDRTLQFMTRSEEVVGLNATDSDDEYYSLVP